jgi:D-alanyl-D-alanine dipeptidase
MGGAFDFFGARSSYGFKGISASQAANRKLLRTVMTAAGFKPYNTEWWHFSRAQWGIGGFPLRGRETLAQ